MNLVPWRGFAGVRATIDRFDAHALHQRRHMATAHRDALAPQQIAQHPRPGEGEVEMQFVEAAHQLQILRRDPAAACNRPCSAKGRAPSPDGQSRGRGCGRSSLCAQQSRFCERAFQKIILQRQLADLGVKRFQIDGGFFRLCLLLSENARRALQQLTPPRGDLVGVHIELLRQFGKSLLALDRANATVALKAGECVRRLRFVIECSRFAARTLAAVRQKIHSSYCPNFQGQLYGYAGYRALAERTNVQLAFCRAHLRRRFYELAAAGPAPIASEALERIGQLYAVESEIRGRCAQERRDARWEKSWPILGALEIWLREKLTLISQKTKLAEAIRYALSRWERLTRFVDDGRVEIDSNVVERVIRPIALNRKNALFAGSDGGGENWAIVASLIETCKLNGVDPQAYLTQVLGKIVDGHLMTRIDELMPWSYRHDKSSSVAS